MHKLTVEQLRDNWAMGFMLGGNGTLAEGYGIIDGCLDEVRREARTDVMLAFFKRFKATGSVSVEVIKKWWSEQIKIKEVPSA